MQTIVDVIYTDEEVFNLFLETLMDKFFKGRNLNIKSNEFKFIVRYCHNKNPNSFNMILRLMKYLGSKESGGGRTQHQVNQAISFMNYVLDHIRSKFEDDKKSDRAPRTFKEDEILQVVKNMIEIVKESLKSKDNDEAKLKSFYTELIKFYIKLHGLITKINSNFTTEVNKSQKKIQAVLLKLIESYSINGLKDKIEELSKSTLDI